MTWANYGTLVTIMFIFVFIYTGAANIGEVALNKNSILDSQSEKVISDISNKLDDNLSAEDLKTSQTRINDTSQEGQSAFAQKDLQQEKDQKTKLSVVEKVKAVPDLMALSLGVPRNYYTEFFALLNSIIALAIAFATTRTLFGPSRLTKR